MPDRFFTECPHCGRTNTYSMAELMQVQPAAKGAQALRLRYRPLPAPGPQEYVVRCNYCQRPFKVILREPRSAP